MTPEGGATYQYVMRSLFVGVVTIVALIALVGGALAGLPGGNARGRTASPPPATLADPRPQTPGFIVALAAREAAGNCDSHPTGASYVRTTRQTAEAMSGDGVDSDPPVYLVVLRGDFVDYYAHGMYRARADFPRGMAITFTLDAATHEILDFGIGGQAPDLAQLGEVHDFTAELRDAPERPSPSVCS